MFSIPFRFVRFFTAEEALKAVSELNKWTLHGTRIIVDIARDTITRIQEGIKTDYEITFSYIYEFNNAVCCLANLNYKIFHLGFSDNVL